MLIIQKKSVTAKKKPTKTVWAHCRIHSFLIAAISLKSKQIPFSTCHRNMIFLISLEIFRMQYFNQTVWYPYVFPIMAINRLMRRIVTIMMNIRKCIWKLKFFRFSLGFALSLPPCRWCGEEACNMATICTVWQSVPVTCRTSATTGLYKGMGQPWCDSLSANIPWRSFQRARCEA